MPFLLVRFLWASKENEHKTKPSIGKPVRSETKTGFLIKNLQRIQTSNFLLLFTKVVLLKRQKIFKNKMKLDYLGRD